MGDIGFISTAQKLTFSIKDFLSNCDQMSSFVRIFSHLMKKFLMENIIFVQCSLRDPIHVQEYNRSKETRNMLRLFLKKSCIQKASGAEKKQYHWKNVTNNCQYMLWRTSSQVFSENYKEQFLKEHISSKLLAKQQRHSIEI